MILERFAVGAVRAAAMLLCGLGVSVPLAEAASMYLLAAGMVGTGYALVAAVAVLAIGLRDNFGNTARKWKMQVIHELLRDVQLVALAFAAVTPRGQIDWATFSGLVNHGPAITLYHLFSVVLIARLLLLAIHHLIAECLGPSRVTAR